MQSNKMNQSSTYFELSHTSSQYKQDTCTITPQESLSEICDKLPELADESSYHSDERDLSDLQIDSTTEHQIKDVSTPELEDISPEKPITTIQQPDTLTMSLPHQVVYILTCIHL